MSDTYYEQEAKRMLAGRGAQETPRELYRDIADALEKMREEGRVTALRSIRQCADLALHNLRQLATEVDASIAVAVVPPSVVIPALELRIQRLRERLACIGNLAKHTDKPQMQLDDVYQEVAEGLADDEQPGRYERRHKTYKP